MGRNIHAIQNHHTKVRILRWGFQVVTTVETRDIDFRNAPVDTTRDLGSTCFSTCTVIDQAHSTLTWIEGASKTHGMIVSIILIHIVITVMTTRG